MKPKEISIILNGFEEKVPENSTIAELIARMNEKDGGLIVEHNNKYVFSQRYSETTLAEGDKLELINPDFGG